jgi:hypothetical protein
VWDLVGWLVWAAEALTAISFAWGCRSYTKAGIGFQWATGVQTFFLWVIAVLFLILDWNKLHILWLAPILFLTAPAIALSRVPVLSTIVFYAARAFLRLILIGTNKSTYFETLVA